MVDISDLRPGMRVKLVKPEEAKWVAGLMASLFLGKIVTIKEVVYGSRPSNQYITIEEGEIGFRIWAIEEIVDDTTSDDEFSCEELVFDIASLYAAQ